jgi:hypothetical protein
MNADENRLIEALRHLKDDRAVDPGLVDRSAHRGERRLARRRLGAGLAAAAVVAIAVPAAITLTPGGGGHDTTLTPATGSSAGNTHHSAKAGDDNHGCGSEPSPGPTRQVLDPASHPDLLLLPPGQQFSKAQVVRDPGLMPCGPNPPIAGAFYRAKSHAVTASVLVKGPHAPTAAQEGFTKKHPDVDPGDPHAWKVGSARVDGQRAITNFMTGSKGRNSVEVYWTARDGSRWHAQTTGMTQAEAVKVLNRLQLNPAARTATMPNAAASGWATFAAGRHPARPNEGVSLYAQWTDSGVPFGLSVTKQPDDVFPPIAGTRVVSVNGHRALLFTEGGEANLSWRAADGLSISLTAGGLGLPGKPGDHLLQIANSLKHVSPDDPRLKSPLSK